MSGQMQQQQSDQFPSVPFAEPMGDTGVSSIGNDTRRNVRGPDARTPSIRDAKHHNRDWLKQQAAQHSAKSGSDLTGLAPKAFQNIREGQNKISFDNLVEWCRNDPSFAAAFAEHVGLILPGEAEFAGAITHAVNAYMRRQGTRG